MATASAAACTKNATPGAVPPPINASSSSSSSMPTPTLAPPTNFLIIVCDYCDIKDAYTIDPSLPLLPGAVHYYGDDVLEPLNLCVMSEYGRIDVVIELVCRGDTKGPAWLAINAQNSDATIAVHDRMSNRFRLKAISGPGSVVVRLPSTFLGPFSTRLKYENLTFSPAVQARLVTLLEEEYEKRFFIGDYASSGYEDDKPWHGDHLCVETGSGTVKIEFVDEESETPETLVKKPEPLRRKGLFRRLLC